MFSIGGRDLKEQETPLAGLAIEDLSSLPSVMFLPSNPETPKAQMKQPANEKLHGGAGFNNHRAQHKPQPYTPCSNVVAQTAVPQKAQTFGAPVGLRLSFAPASPDKLRAPGDLTAHKGRL